MTTLATIRDRIISRAAGPRAQMRDKQSGTLTAAGTSVSVLYDRPDIGPDAVLEWPDGDLAFVWTGSAGTYTIERGFYGTTAADHAAGEIVTINPRWTRVEVFELMLEEINSWPEQLGIAEFIDVNVTSGNDIIELPVSGKLTRVGAIRRKDGVNLDYERVDVAVVRSAEFEYGLQIEWDERIAGVLEVQCMYRPDLSCFTADTEFEYSGAMTDVLILGTLWRMMSTQEIGRTDDVATVNARNEAVPPTYLTQSAEYFRTIRDQRLAEEKARVYNEFPLIMSDLA